MFFYEGISVYISTTGDAFREVGKKHNSFQNHRRLDFYGVLIVCYGYAH